MIDWIPCETCGQQSVTGLCINCLEAQLLYERLFDDFEEAAAEVLIEEIDLGGATLRILKYQ